MKVNICFWSYLAHFFLEWKMFLTKLYRNSKHILYTITCFLKSFHLWDNMEIYLGSGQALHAGFLRLQIHILKLFNTYRFSLQRWLHKRVSVSRYTYIACLVALLSDHQLYIVKNVCVCMYIYSLSDCREYIWITVVTK